jgi:hypothetical protein
MPDETAPLAKRIFAARAVLWLVFLGPLFYAAYLADVITHEALGHGVLALLCGGQFSGFEIHLDGMGRAYGWTNKHPDLMLAGGVLAEIAVGLPLMGVAVLDRCSTLRRAALASIGLLFLVSAGLYGFWNTYYPRPPGDWGRLVADMPSPGLRLALVIGFGALTVTASIAGSVILFRSLENNLGPLRGWRLVAVITPYVIGGIVLNFLLDWNLLIEHVGRIPQFGGALLQLAVALLLPLWRRPNVQAGAIRGPRWVFAIAASWAACGALVLAVCLWGVWNLRW